MSTSSFSFAFHVRIDMVPRQSIIETMREKGIEILPRWKKDVEAAIKYLFTGEGERFGFSFSDFTSVNGEDKMEVTVDMERRNSNMIRVEVRVDHPDDQMPGYGYFYGYEANA